LRRHLHEIEVELLRLPERVLGRHDPDLRPIRADQPDLR